MGMFGARRPLPLVKAMNVVTRRPGGTVALACPTHAGRLLVALPWRGRLAIGTSHGTDLCGPDQTIVNASEVSAFLTEINDAFPWLSLTLDDVTLVHRGVVPARVAAGRAPALLDHPQILDHGDEGTPGAVSVIGVKYTTARAVAGRAVDVVCRQLGRDASRPPAVEPLTTDDGTRLGRLYGPEADTVRQAARERPPLGAPLGDGIDVTGAEVVHAVRSELALTLEDVVVRRTAIGAAGHPGPQAIAACAAIMAQELGWSAERVRDEMAGLERFYEIGPGPADASPQQAERMVSEAPGVSH
jgi:glycerol-3-phosphate dehydrogenase